MRNLILDTVRHCGLIPFYSALYKRSLFLDSTEILYINFIMSLTHILNSVSMRFYQPIGNVETRAANVTIRCYTYLEHLLAPGRWRNTGVTLTVCQHVSCWRDEAKTSKGLFNSLMTSFCKNDQFFITS